MRIQSGRKLTKESIPLLKRNARYETRIELPNKETARISIFNTKLYRKSLFPRQENLRSRFLILFCLRLLDSLSNYVTSVDLFRSWKTGTAGKESNTQAIKLTNQQIGHTDHATAILFVGNDAQAGIFLFVL